MTTQYIEARTDAVVDTSGATDTGGAMTLEQLLALCVQLQPVEAAMRGDSSLCVTPLITTLFMDGKIVELKLKGGRWAAGYPRVSGEVQRAAASAAGKTKKKSQRRKSTQQVAQMQQMVSGREGLEDSGNSPLKAKGSADGYSEEEQLTRQIRHFVRQGWAFRIYSDCGLTGEYPSNDPRLIRRLLDGKAARYQKIYERTLLDETSLSRRTPGQIASMRAYLAKRVAQIKGGQVTDNEFAPIDHEAAALGEDDLAADVIKTGDKTKKDNVRKDNAKKSNTISGDAPSRQPGRPRRKVYFRQAFTQLWKDIEAGKVHTVAVSDRSRLCRAADLESEFLLLLSRHDTRLVGLIEDLSTLDVSDPLRKGFAYMIASVNEYRLEETSGHSFRGLLQLLESGHPHGRPPWWLIRDVQGRAVEMPAYVPHARRVAELYLAGLGVAAIVTKLHDEGIRIGGEPLTAKMVRYVLDSDATSGIHWQFGLAWDIYPPLLPPETVAELRERRHSRRDILLPQFGARQPGRTWANHLFTGLLRCSCGYLLRYSPPSRTPHIAGRIAYYFCPAPHKRAPGAPAHAWVNEDKLSAFLSELLGENPHLIANALSAGGDRAARSAARRTLLEARLQQARQAYVAQEADAQEKAVQAALSAGLKESSASFSSVVAEIRRGLLEAERSALTALEAELVQLGAEAGQDKQAARVLAAVGQLQQNSLQENPLQKNSLQEPHLQKDQPVSVMDKRVGAIGTGAMDVLTRNNLLKAIFAEITVYPFGYKKKKAGQEASGQQEVEQRKVVEQQEARRQETEPVAAGGGNNDISKTDILPRGCLVMRLAGVDTPLPPVRMRRLRGKEMRLPSIAEWIADIYALAPVEEGGAGSNVRARRPFYQVLHRLVSSTAEGSRPGDDGRPEDNSRPEDVRLRQLLSCIQADEEFPRRCKGDKMIRVHLAQNDLYSEVCGYFEEAWAVYLQTEQQRLAPPSLDQPLAPPLE